MKRLKPRQAQTEAGAQARVAHIAGTRNMLLTAMQRVRVLPICYARRGSTHRSLFTPEMSPTISRDKGVVADVDEA